MGGPETWWTHRGIRRYPPAPPPKQFRGLRPSKSLDQMREEVLEQSTRARLETTNLQSAINLGLTAPMASDSTSSRASLTNGSSSNSNSRPVIKSGLEVKAAIMGVPPRWEEFVRQNSSGGLDHDVFTANSLKAYLTHSPSHAGKLDAQKPPPTLYKIPSMSGIITYEGAPFRPQTSSSIYGSHYELPALPNATGYLRQPLHLAPSVSHNRYAS